MKFVTLYESKYIKKIDEYLRKNKDEYIEFHKTRNVSDDGKLIGSNSFESKVRVKLPSKRGFAKYINVSRKTLYNWANEHPDFEEALEAIDQEQYERLINAGLEGSYNPTITKVLLSANHGVKEGIDASFKGEVTTVFKDEQIDKIAERITARRRNDGGTGGEKLSN